MARRNSALGAVLLAALGAWAAADDWPTYGRNNLRTHYTPERFGPPFRLLWRWNTDPSRVRRIAYQNQVVVAGGLLCIGDYAGTMHGLDAKTGKERWRYRAAGPIVHAAAIAGGRVFFGSEAGEVVCLEARTGRKVWSYTAGAGIRTAPAVENGTVYVASLDRCVYAFKAATGRRLWKTDVGAPVSMTPAVAEGRIFLGAWDVVARCLDAATGKLLWSAPLEGWAMHAYAPAVWRDKVVFRTAPFGSLWDGGLDTPFPDRMVAFYKANPTHKHLFVLNTRTGKEEYVVGLPYTTGVYSIPCQVCVAPSGKAYAASRHETGGMNRADIAEIDLSTGKMRIFLDGNMHRARRSGHFRLVTDETSSLSIAGDSLLIAMAQVVGGVEMRTKSLRSWGVCSTPCYDGATQHARWSLPLYPPQVAKARPLLITENPFYWGAQHNAPEYAPAVVADGVLYWMGNGCGIAAVAMTKEARQ